MSVPYPCPGSRRDCRVSSHRTGMHAVSGPAVLVSITNKEGKPEIHRPMPHGKSVAREVHAWFALTGEPYVGTNELCGGRGVAGASARARSVYGQRTASAVRRAQ